MVGTLAPNLGVGAAARFYYVSAAGQQTFSGADASPQVLTLSYTPGYVEVSVDGIWLTPDEYTATNGSSIVFPVGLAAGRKVYVYCLSTFAVANAVSYMTAQSLSLIQQNLARQNIGIDKKNYIVNGAMMVSQQNGSTAGSTSGYYPVDQFVMGSINASASIAQVSSATPGGSPNRIRLTITAAHTVAAGDFLAILQKIEGLRIADLRFGSSAAKTIIIQFGVKAPAGIYCVILQNAASNRSFVAEYTIAAGEANTDVIKSVTIPGDQTGTWATDNTIGLEIIWSLMVGSTYQQAPGAWGTGNVFGDANQFNLASTNGNVFELFDVGLYEGTYAPTFKVPDFASELMLCRRYWESTFPIGMVPASNIGGTASGYLAGPSISSTSSQSIVPWQYIIKRAIPTVTTYNPFAAGSGFSASGSGNFTANQYSLGAQYAAFRETSGGVSAGANLSLHAVADARL